MATDVVQKRMKERLSSRRNSAAPAPAPILTPRLALRQSADTADSSASATTSTSTSTSTSRSSCSDTYDLSADCHNPAELHHLRTHALAPIAVLGLAPRRCMRWEICLRRCSLSECNDLSCCGSSIGSVDLVIPLPSFAPSPNSPHSLQPHYYDLWQTHQQNPPILASRIDPLYAGNGYSTEAIKAVLLHVFSNGTPVSKRLSRVHAAFADSNPVKPRAAKILKRLGFSVAERVSPSMSRNGVPIEGWTLFECKRDEFMDLWTDS
ncbi:hypothetical protein HDU83_002041 [Entophlyctis luteolus]|nr:hypothetical protein HDU83_002041 [Entophlyctis luteolus]